MAVVATWDGAGHPAPVTDVLAAAEVFVLPYMGPATNAALTVQMPRVRVVQALTAGRPTAPVLRRATARGRGERRPTALTRLSP